MVFVLSIKGVFGICAALETAKGSLWPTFLGILDGASGLCQVMTMISSRCNVLVFQR